MLQIAGRDEVVWALVWVVSLVALDLIIDLREGDPNHTVFELGGLSKRLQRACKSGHLCLPVLSFQVAHQMNELKGEIE